MCGKYQLAIDFCQVLFFWLMVCRAISCSIGARFELGCTHYYEVSAGVTDVQTEIEQLLVSHPAIARLFNQRHGWQKVWKPWRQHVTIWLGCLLVLALMACHA